VERNGRRPSALISGGLGFIGSAIAQQLLALDMDVTVVDNKRSNVLHEDELQDRHSRLRFVEAGICEFLRDSPPRWRCDVVIHAASYVGAVGILPFAGGMAAEMVSATTDVVNFCVRSNAELINISSSEVYGRSGVLTEQDDLRVPPYFNARIEYALAKLTGEAVVANSADKGLRALSIRPFNVIGPRQSRAGGFVFPTFVQQALGGLPLTVFGSGRQRRSFVGIDDVVSFVVRCLRTAFPRGATVNVGNPDNTVSIAELAERICTRLRSSSPIAHVDPRAIYGAQYRDAESTDKICKVATAASWGWTPQQSLDDLIDHTAAFFRHARDTRGADARL
jgi:nucleoside-diphosphate-sugar epimerase